MAVRGIFTAHSNIVGDRVGDLASRVLLHMPQGTAPLLALSSGMPKRPAKDITFSWPEDSHISGAANAVGTVAAGVTSFVVNDSNLWVPNTVLLNTATNERMLVTDVAGATITVIREFAGTAGAAITNGDFIHNVGTAFGEGSGKPVPVAQRAETRTNYVQIFKNGWSITGTAKAIVWHTGSQLAMNKQQAMAYHTEDIEKAFLFGAKGYGQVGDQTVWLSDGVYQQVEQYGGLVEAATVGINVGQMNMTNLLDYLRRIFITNVAGAPNERIAFTSSQVLQHINTMSRMDTTYNIQQGDEKDTFGFIVTTIVGLNGRLKLLTHPMFDFLQRNDLLVLHPQFIAKRELRDIETHEFTSDNDKNNGIDADDGFVLSHLGFEVGGTRTMGILQNIVTPVASFV